MKKLSIGISDYKELVENDYYYIDKTLLIKELSDVGGKVTLLPRPRRFGKTLNLSMLRYFFEQSSQDTSHLFTHTAIWQEEKYCKKQGQYPVILITFKDVKEKTWGKAYDMLINLISGEFNRHRYLLEKNLPTHIKAEYQAILEKRANEASYKRSLLFLCELLYNHYQKNVVILIDEYDTPITAAYHYNYYEDIITFMRGLLGGALKDNNFLERGVVTDALCMDKQSLFTELKKDELLDLFPTTIKNTWL